MVDTPDAEATLETNTASTHRPFHGDLDRCSSDRVVKVLQAVPPSPCIQVVV